jgi:hypothetical protein
LGSLLLIAAVGKVLEVRMPQGSIETLKKPPRMAAWSNLKRTKISPSGGGKSYLIVTLTLVSARNL